MQSQSLMKPRDLFGARPRSKLPPIKDHNLQNSSQQYLNPYLDQSTASISTNLFRSVKLDNQLSKVKNKNLRIQLEVQQLGKDIYDNVLQYHKPDEEQQKKRFQHFRNKTRLSRDYGERVLTQEELTTDYEAREKREAKILEQFDLMIGRVESNQSNKCWNSVSLQMQNKSMQDLMRKQKARRYGGRSQSSFDF